ncbi:MAG: hypothetical protein ACLQGP_39905 [Isosphaeraceae bacterium]
MKELVNPPPSEGIDALFRDAEAKTRALQNSLAATPGAITSGLSITAPAKTTQATESKLASAIERGSQEAANIELRARYGGGRNTAADTTAKNTGSIDKKLDALPVRIGEAIGRAIGGGRGPKFGLNF